MRITENNAPILRRFRERKFGACKVFVTDEEERLGRVDPYVTLWIRSFSLYWKDLCDVFASNIEYVSRPFFKAVLENKEKIGTEENVCKLAGKRYHGTLLYLNGEGTVTQTCYDFEIGPDSSRYVHHFLMFVGNTLVEIKSDFVDKQTVLFPLREVPSGFDSRIDFFHASVNDVINVILFKKYATVEVVEAKSFKKVPFETESDGKILLDSTLKVRCLDCSWFREIVRKEGFLVRGHFRMQPYKNERGQWDYKLIYIEPFEKHGYVRHAKKDIGKDENL